MKWPWVHRARLEAACDHARRLSAMLDCAHAQRDGLLSELLRMKRDGFSPLAAKIPPSNPDTEARYTKAVDESPNPEIQKLIQEGYSEAEARQIVKEALEDYAKGGM